MDYVDIGDIISNKNAFTRAGNMCNPFTKYKLLTSGITTCYVDLICVCVNDHDDFATNQNHLFAPKMIDAYF